MSYSVSPESCGFGLREFKLTRELDKIEIKQQMQTKIELTLNSSQMKQCVVPANTLDIVTLQKKAANQEFGVPSIVAPSKEEIKKY